MNIELNNVIDSLFQKDANGKEISEGFRNWLKDISESFSEEKIQKLLNKFGKEVH